MSERRPWTDEDVAKLKAMARRRAAADIAGELRRGLSATVMKAHQLGICGLNRKKVAAWADVSERR